MDALKITVAKKKKNYCCPSKNVAKPKTATLNQIPLNDYKASKADVLLWFKHLKYILTNWYSLS